MNSKTTKIKKSKVFEQFVDAVNHREFDYESYEQVTYWLSQFTDGSSDEDLYYLHSAIDLISRDNTLVFAYFEAAFYNKYSFVDRILLNSGSINYCFVASIYKSMMDNKVFEYVFKEPIGVELHRKIGVIIRESLKSKKSNKK